MWQQFIESKFPAYTLSKVEVDDGGKGVEVEKRLNLGNTLIKFCLDQSVIAVINVGLFLGGIKALQGVPLDLCWQIIKDVSSLVKGRLKLNVNNKAGAGLGHAGRVQALAPCELTELYCNTCGAKDTGW